MKSWIAVAVSLIVIMITVTPILAQQGSGGNRGPGGKEHFQRLDTDGDGQISEEEWVVHQTERFQEIDADGDGFASEEEMEAHHKSMRRGRQQRGRGGKRTDDQG